jgi:hypothetical protein
MITPAFETESWCITILVFILLMNRIHDSFKRYNKYFVRELLYFSIFTSLIWLFFGYRNRMKKLMCRLTFLMIIYGCIIIYIETKTESN